MCFVSFVVTPAEACAEPGDTGFVHVLRLRTAALRKIRGHSRNPRHGVDVAVLMFFAASRLRVRQDVFRVFSVFRRVH